MAKKVKRIRFRWYPIVTTYRVRYKRKQKNKTSNSDGDSLNLNDRNTTSSVSPKNMPPDDSTLENNYSFDDFWT